MWCTPWANSCPAEQGCDACIYPRYLSRSQANKGDNESDRRVGPGARFLCQVQVSALPACRVSPAHCVRYKCWSVTVLGKREEGVNVYIHVDVDVILKPNHGVMSFISTAAPLIAFFSADFLQWRLGGGAGGRGGRGLLIPPLAYAHSVSSNILILIIYFTTYTCKWWTFTYHVNYL